MDEVKYFSWTSKNSQIGCLALKITCHKLKYTNEPSDNLWKFDSLVYFEISLIIGKIIFCIGLFFYTFVKKELYKIFLKLKFTTVIFTRILA